jgi:hypothetical protein
MNNTIVEFKDSHIHLLHSPGFIINVDSATKTFSNIAEICQKHKCYRILLECESPERILTISNVFQIAEYIFSTLPLSKIAFCFYNYQIDSVSEFFKTVALNRGISIGFFLKKEKAINWLKYGMSNS